MSRICTECRSEKEITEFPKYKGKTGNILIRWKCKACTAKAHEWYVLSLEERKEKLLPLTIDLITNRIIKQARGQRLTDAGARQAIEDGVRAYGDYKYKQGLAEAKKALLDFNKAETIKTLLNIMEMV